MVTMPVVCEQQIDYLLSQLCSLWGSWKHLETMLLNDLSRLLKFSLHLSLGGVGGREKKSNVS